MSRGSHWLPALPKFENTWRIPRIIHQTCSSLDLPTSLRENIDRLKSANQTWDHRLYDDSGRQGLIGRIYGEDVLSVYRRINKIEPYNEGVKQKISALSSKK